MIQKGKDDGAWLPFRDPGLPLGERVRDLLSRLTLEEKAGMMASRQVAVPRLGIREFHIGGEGAHGLVAKGGPATAFPQTIGLSCSWDEDLLRRVGSVIGDEARAYYRKRGGSGGLCLYAPTVDMERHPRWGRTEEGYGEDPRLAGRLSAAYVSGLQGDHPFYLKAVAAPKHFYANNNDERRTSCSASVDPRSRREYYLAAFEPAVARAKAASLMTSYNAINGIPAMLHPDVLGVAKGEWGMEGYVVCDGGALRLLVSDHKRCDSLAEAAALSVKAGVDNFTEETDLVRDALREALTKGLLAEADIDRALARVMAVRVRLGQFDPPGIDPYGSIDETVLWNPDSRRLALRAARESIVLLSNRPAGSSGRPGLPLDARALRSLAVLGPLADACYRDWYAGVSAYRVSPFQALCERLPGLKLIHADGCDIVHFRALDGRPIGPKSWYAHELAANRQPSEEGEMFRRTDWGWGNQTFRSLSGGGYLTTDDSKLMATAGDIWGWYVKERFSLEDARLTGEPGAVLMRSWKGDPVSLSAGGELAVTPLEKGGACTPLVMETARSGLEEAVRTARACDAALLFLGNHPLLNSKEEIDRPSLALPPEQERLADAVTDANPRTVVVIVGSYPYALGPWREKAAAIVYAPHGGQEAGNALADIILGACPPSGRLSMTWYADDGAPGDIMDYDIARKGATYLHYSGKPLYPFGHGLGYSTVEYLGMELSSGSIGPRGEVRARIRLKNPGGADAVEVVQLYASVRGSGLRRPLLQLADFTRVALPAGASAETELVLRAQDIAAWDPGIRDWFLEEGECLLSAGASSADLRLQRTLRVDGSPLRARDPYAWIDAENFDDIAGLELWEGDGALSCLRRARLALGESAFLTFDRMDFGKGGNARFEAQARGAAEGKIYIGFPESPVAAKSAGLGVASPVAWTAIAEPIVLPAGKTAVKLCFEGNISLLRFRFQPEGER